MTLDRSHLDKLTCVTPECTHEDGAYFLHSNCHPRVPTWAMYQHGAVTIICAECHKIVCQIAVAEPT